MKVSENLSSPRVSDSEGRVCLPLWCRGTCTRNTRQLRREHGRLSLIFMVLLTQGRTAVAQHQMRMNAFLLLSSLPLRVPYFSLFHFPAFTLLPSYPVQQNLLLLSFYFKVLPPSLELTAPYRALRRIIKNKAASYSQSLPLETFRAPQTEFCLPPRGGSAFLKHGVFLEDHLCPRELGGMY